jgi:hypothetical protein
MQRLFLAAVLACAMPALADVQSGTPRFNWSQPGVWSDGSALTAAQITGYQIDCGGAANVSRRVAAASGVPPFQTPDAERYAPGAYTCTLAVDARQTTPSAEVLGAASAPVVFTVPQPAPVAPADFSVD